MIAEVKNRIAGFGPELDREVQSELAKLIKLLGLAQIKLQEKQDSSVFAIKAIVDDVEVAINALNSKPNTVLSQKLRYAAKARLREIQGGWLCQLVNAKDNFFHILRTPTKVLIGLLLAIPLNWFILNGFTLNLIVCSWEVKGAKELLSYLADQNLPEPTPAQSPTLAEISSSQTNQLERINEEKILQLLILLCMTGTLGGAISILTRIESFQNQKYGDDFLPFLVGAVKPFLGSSFGFFIFLLINSSILPIDLEGKDGDNSNAYWYSVLTLAFIAGFSERLVPDLISQVERRYVPPSTPEGQGLPIEMPVLMIEPPNPNLHYEDTQEFTLKPPFKNVDDYEINLEPPGDFSSKTPSTFVYLAPKKVDADAKGIKEVKIIVTSKTDPSKIATATVTLV